MLKLLFSLYISEKLDLSTPHNGQVQSSGRDSKGVSGAIPLSESPLAGSYSYPQTSQINFFINIKFYQSKVLQLKVQNSKNLTFLITITVNLLHFFVVENRYRKLFQ